MMRLESFKQISATSAEILEVIQQGIDAFAQLKTQWWELKMFFDSMAKLMEATLSPRMNEFIAQAETSRVIRNPSPASKEIVYQSAYEAAKVAYVVNHLADSYCSISKSHLMPLTMKLDTLISLDKVRDAEKIQNERRALSFEARNAQAKIKEIIERKHNAFERSTTERMKAIDEELRKLPPLTNNEQAAIRQRAEENVAKINQEKTMSLSDFC